MHAQFVAWTGISFFGLVDCDQLKCIIGVDVMANGALMHQDLLASMWIVKPCLLLLYGKSSATSIKKYNVDALLFYN